MREMVEAAANALLGLSERGWRESELYAAIRSGQLQGMSSTGKRIAVFVLPLLLGVAFLACGCVKQPKRIIAGPKRALDELPAEAGVRLRKQLEAVFGTLQRPSPPQAIFDWLDTRAEDLRAGAREYVRLCAHCHGLNGDGTGPVAKQLFPRPRDFRLGIFKFTSTGTAAKPTPADLLATIREGIPTTAMVSYEVDYQHRPAAIRAIRDYVIYLGVRGETERYGMADYWSGYEPDEQSLSVQANRVLEFWREAGGQVVEPPDAQLTFEPGVLAHGQRLFRSDVTQCAECHGPAGRGDRPDLLDPEKVTDIWGHYSPPSNLTVGLFRGGGRPTDLFRRLYVGVKGTPMPAQAENLTGQQIWAVAPVPLSLASPPLCRNPLSCTASAKSLAFSAAVALPWTRN